jgi:tRNA G18 (ribose-2'-O)-methylase SpoU
MLVIIAGQADSLNVAMATVITLFVLSELFAK